MSLLATLRAWWRAITIAATVGLIIAAYLRRNYGVLILTDSRKENVEILKRYAAHTNKLLPKMVGAARTRDGRPSLASTHVRVERVDATSAGIVNHYKLTSFTYSRVSDPGIMDRLRPQLREVACSYIDYRTIMEKGFSVGFSAVDKNGSPMGTVTITNADCPKKDPAWAAEHR